MVLGIDGGEIGLIKKWQQDLPTLSKLIKEGVCGILETAIPPMTVPCWNCLFTGKNPGRIGLYNFVLVPSGDLERIRIVNYRDQKASSIWEILSNHGFKVITVNVPTTYPPRPVNGIVISGGLLSPLYKDVEYVLPKIFKEELERIAQGYEILPLTDLTILGREDEYLNLFYRNIEKQRRVILHLIDSYQWDFFTYVFFITDSVQHYFWKYLDSALLNLSLRTGSYQNAIKLIYQKVDAVIGEILKKLPSDVDVFVVSDHGFQALKGYFMVNEWLAENGLLKIHHRRNVYYNIVLKSKNFLLSLGGEKLANLLIPLVPRSLVEKVTVRGQLQGEGVSLLKQIDWQSTWAFSVGEAGGIFLNRKRCKNPETYNKVREEIAESLKSICNSDRQRLDVQIWMREDLYKGGYIEDAPDIVFSINDFQYVQRAGMGYRSVWTKPPFGGWHRKKATFIAWGPHIKAGKNLPNLSIYDITPTILHIFGLPIPKDMDGRVLTEIFEENSEPARRPVVYQEIDEQERMRRKIKEIKRTRII